MVEMSSLVDSLVEIVVEPSEHHLQSEGETFPRRMSTPMLTSDMQLRYIVQWFEEFSELQKQDFLPILAHKLASDAQVNGIVGNLAALNCEDKPLSLFQCRMKLFNQWFPTWSEEDRNRFVKSISETDPEFHKRLQDEIANPGGNKEADTFSYDESEVTCDDKTAATDVESKSDESKKEFIGNEQIDNIHEVGITENNIPLEIAATS